MHSRKLYHRQPATKENHNSSKRRLGGRHKGFYPINLPSFLPHSQAMTQPLCCMCLHNTADCICWWHANCHDPHTTTLWKVAFYVPDPMYRVCLFCCLCGKLDRRPREILWSLSSIPEWIQTATPNYHHQQERHRRRRPYSWIGWQSRRHISCQPCKPPLHVSTTGLPSWAALQSDMNDSVEWDISGRVTSHERVVGGNCEQTLCTDYARQFPAMVRGMMALFGHVSTGDKRMGWRVGRVEKGWNSVLIS